jgi:hypothetical protein
MSTIHHQYRSFHLVFRDDSNNYRVTHDRQPELCDPYLHHPSLVAARRYVDVICDVTYGFVLEPFRSRMLLPFYRHGYRSDGPLPPDIALLLTDRPFTTPGLCNHVFCRVSPYNLLDQPVWQYCGNRVRPGSTRCYDHHNYSR